MKTSLRVSMQLLLAPMALLIASLAALGASGEADFKRAYATALAAEKQAGKLRNQWTVTETSLAEARKAADQGDFTRAIAAAREAEALAKASIFQAAHEKEAWKDLDKR